MVRIPDMPAEVGNKRTLRQRLERKIYDDEGLDEDEIDGKRNFNLYDKLESDRYDGDFVKEMDGEDVNVKYLQENGFKCPLLIKEKQGLGIRVPSKNFTVEEVKKCVGSRRNIDVLDVTTQKAMEMTMKDWVKYYTTDADNRDRLLNVLSLECSHTRMENYVEQPEIVKQIDWVDTVWPRHLKDKQTETTNILEKMYYPKVQRYCLMSVEGCYTDFHIDMGGTSVWYHILHGAKIFWLIPPTEKNLKLYENWILSGKQGDEFFADKVEKCQRLWLQPGWTFLIPTGWIHGVYTPKDSLVFGGNYIHSFNISLQLRIWDIENKTHVPMKFRYPFFTEMHWYVLERYVHTLTGKSHREKTGEELKDEIDSLKNDLQPLSPMSPAAQLDSTEDEKSNDSSIFPQSPIMSEHNYNTSNNKLNSSKKKQVFVRFENGISSPLTNGDYNGYSSLNSNGGIENGLGTFGVKVHLTRYELEGINDIIAFLQNLPTTKRFVPKDIINPEGLLEDSKIMLIEHQTDDPEFAVTGEFTLRWAPRKKDNKPKVRTYTTHFQARGKAKKVKGGQRKEPGARKLKRRVRCKQCEPCTREDCQLCHFCKDMKKFGGPGVMKQCCLSRQCIAPVLPKTASCRICESEKKLNLSEMVLKNEIDTCIMECGFCYEIVHPYCLKNSDLDLLAEGVENEDLPNSWECARCVQEGKGASTTVWKKEYPKGPGQKRLVIVGGRKLSTDSESSSMKEEACSLDTLPPVDIENGSIKPISKSTSGNHTMKEETKASANGSSSNSVTVSPSSSLSNSSFSMKLGTNGHIQVEGLRQVSVQIERLKDIDRLSPTSSPNKRLDSPIKNSPIKKRSENSPTLSRSNSGNASQKSSPQSEPTSPKPISSCSFYSSPKSGDKSPNKTGQATVKSFENEDFCSETSNASHGTKRKRLTRSSSAQSESSQEDNSTPITRRRISSSGPSTPVVIKTPSGQNTPLERSINSKSESTGRVTPTVRRLTRRTREEEPEASSSGEEQTPTKRVKKNHYSCTNITKSPVVTINSNTKSIIIRITSPNKSPTKSEGSPIPGTNNEVSPVDDYPKQAGRGSVQGQRSSQRSSGGASSSSNPNSGSRAQGSNKNGNNGGGQAMNGNGGVGGGDGEPPPGGSGEGGKSGCNEGGKKDNDEDEEDEDNDDTNNKGGNKNGSTTKKKEAGNSKIPDLKPCKVLVHKYVIRPAPIPAPPKYVKCCTDVNHPLDQLGWMEVFHRLDKKDLVSCLRVCKTWYRWVMDPALWADIDLSNEKIKQPHLIGIVKRQPQSLNFSNTNIKFRQLEWLIARLPHLRHLNMSGNSWPAVSSLCTSSCPLLTMLDLSWVSGLRDACLKDLFSPPIDRRPGIDNTTSRFHNCTKLTLTGSDITDFVLPIIKQNLPKLEKLGLSCCTKITDSGIESIAPISTLKEMDLSKCRGLTPKVFEHLKKVTNLCKLNITACMLIAEKDIISFAKEVGGRYLRRPCIVVIEAKGGAVCKEGMFSLQSSRVKQEEPFKLPEGNILPKNEVESFAEMQDASNCGSVEKMEGVENS